MRDLDTFIDARRLRVRLLLALGATVGCGSEPPRGDPPASWLADPLAAGGGASTLRWITCSPDAQAQGASCGKLSVPLDRLRPNGQQIEIYFERYGHTKPGPAESALVLNPGGPGTATTQGGEREIWLTTFAANRDVHDLLMIDDRGRGLSTTLDCARLQHGTGTSLDAEIEECAAQLGASDGDYATGEIALDTEAVRAALGYDKIDYYGGSWGGVDATAYATRFGEHVRSLILDTPQGPKGLKPFQTETHQASATLDEIRLECIRSPTCSLDHPAPAAEFAALVQAVRNRPFSGIGHDLNGNSTNVRFDESLLVTISINGTFAVNGANGSTGELLAAGASFEQGDPVPLLRLGAEAGGGNLLFDSGPSTAFSWGAFFATVCSDMDVPYSWNDPRAARLAQLDREVMRLPPGRFFPFSGSAVISEVGGSNTRLCVSWEEPSRPVPAVPPRAVYPSVPTLVIAADIDALAPVALVRQEAALFPAAKFVTLSEAGHVPVQTDACAAQIATTFLETLATGDTSCLQTPTVVWPAVGRFPRLARDAAIAPPAPGGHNAIGIAEQRVATVAVGTAIDALKRAVMSGGGNGVGLRGGSFMVATTANGAMSVTMTGCRFAEDVVVTGTVVWSPDATLVADLSVAGAGTAGGKLHVAGAWEAPGPVGNFAVSGTLGGKTVAVTVPEA
jgi:pimeloyl-ACP methyl ester carboxylesterase